MGQTIRPAGWTPATGEAGYGLLPPGPAAVTPFSRVPFTRQKRTYAVVAMQTHVPYALSASATDFCLTKRLGLCDGSAYHPGGWVTYGAGSPTDARIFDSFGGPFGEVDATMTAVDTGIAHELFWFVATV